MPGLSSPWREMKRDAITMPESMPAKTKLLATAPESGEKEPANARSCETGKNN
jgi:hypothetical protein